MAGDQSNDYSNVLSHEIDENGQDKDDALMPYTDFNFVSLLYYYLNLLHCVPLKPNTYFSFVSLSFYYLNFCHCVPLKPKRCFNLSVEVVGLPLNLTGRV